MISEYSVENKDFSIALPATISKLALVICMLRWYPHNKELEDIDVYGAAMVLMDINNDIRAIHRALYPEDGYEWMPEPPEPAT